MKVFQVVYTVNGRQDDIILQADDSAEAKAIVKMDYPQAVIKTVKVVRG